LSDPTRDDALKSISDLGWLGEAEVQDPRPET